MWIEKNGGMQGSSTPDRAFYDAKDVCGHLLKAGTVYALLAAHRARLFPDDMFGDLFPVKRGRPSVPADVIASVMVLQALEGLSDREAVGRLETDIRWKIAAGLSLADEAFHSTVLVLWRNKLRASDRPQRIFDAVRAVIAETGILKGKNRRAVDSTVLDDAVARQDTVTMLVAQIRKVRRLIPEIAGIWVRHHNLEGGRPPCDWGDPADRERLITELVDDALTLLGGVEDLQDEGFVLSEVQDEAVALLALVAGQDVEPGDRPGRWKIARGTAKDRTISTVDPETRHAHKTRKSQRDGYKAHVAAEPDTGLITGCDLGAGNEGDAQAAPGLLENEPEGIEVLGDSAYSSADLREHLAKKKMVPVIKPQPLQPAVPGGFTLDDFAIDLTAGTVTCPAKITVTISKTRTATFGKHCKACPLRTSCTTAKAGRTISLHEHHQHLVDARVQARTPEFDAVYRRHRPMIERTLAWCVKDNHRKLRYRGIIKNRIAWSLRCAAVNLKRLLNLGLTRGHDSWTITPA